ncbi:MAG: hypothetical protein HN877_14830, partial [Rhodospirillaceae bacterium]|nr:hypothetical protein [Rhodospirillaceae bacterium]
MDIHHATYEADNHEYHRGIAKSLLSKMSFSEAADICIENNWDGLLRMILGM